jgi:putative hemolysin
LTQEISFRTLTFLLLLVAGSAFFASSETAFLSFQKIRLQQLVGSGSKSARLVEKLLERPARLLSTILLGNNVVNIAFASVMTVLVERLVGPQWSVIVATSVVTIILLVVGEITPKTIALRHGERLAMLFVYPMRVFVFVFTPITFLLGFLTLRSDSARRQVAGEDEIRILVTSGVAEGVIEEEEAELVDRIFSFGDRQVLELLTPRREIIWIEEGTTFSQFLSLYLLNSHTRFPVYKDDIDNVVGILAVKDVLRARAADEISEDSVITDLMRGPIFVPETKDAWELFREMGESRSQITLGVDEYGTITGLVTLKALIGNIVGSVDDEADMREPVTAVGEKAFQVEGIMSVDDANETLSLDIPDGEYNTVAGYLLNEIGRIPSEGELVTLNDLSILVAKMQGTKIEKLVVERRS